MAQQAISERQKIMELYARSQNYERYSDAERFDETQKVRTGAEALEGRSRGLTDFLMGEIDLKALRGLHGDAKQDGVVDRNEGETLRELNHEMRLDTMPSGQALHHMGFNVNQVEDLDAKLVGMDSAASKKDACHVDQDGGQLDAPDARSPENPDAMNLTEDERRLWVDKHAALFDLIHGPKKAPKYGDKPQLDLPGTPMRKIIPERDAAAKATGMSEWNGKVGRASAGGFVARRGETQGQSGEQACATTGLDSTYHEQQGMYDGAKGRFSDAIRNDGATVVDYDATDQVAAGVQVPLGQDAEQIMRAEAERRRSPKGKNGVEEYVPELLRGEDGKALPRVSVQNRETMKDGKPVDRPQTNPFTGWGNAATRRAQDAAGKPFAPQVTQELVSPHVQLPAGAQINRVTPTGEVRNLASATGGGEVQRVDSTGAEPAFDEQRRAAQDRFQTLRGGPPVR